MDRIGGLTNNTAPVTRAWSLMVSKR